MDRPLRHGPNRLRSYLKTHENILDQLIEVGHVTENGLLLGAGYEGEFSLSGTLMLRDGVLRLDVIKHLETVGADGDEDPLVQTRYYSYNVSLSKVGNVFRYDAPHFDDPSAPIAHHKHHHCHRFFPLTGAAERVELSPNGDWPHLDDVIHEANDWYCNNLAQVTALVASKTR